MNGNELFDLAITVVNKPWGSGIDILRNNAEAAPPYYRFLHDVVKKYKSKYIVECGTYMGIGAMHMAVANRNAKVITIDKSPHPRLYSYMTLFPNITLVLGVTTDDITFKDVSKLVDCIGLLFLDSEHDGITPARELEIYSELFCDECLVVCDDILDPRMSSFWADLTGEKVEMNFLHPAQYPNMPNPGFGISIFRR